MTQQEMEALAQGQLDAYNRRDLEKFCAYYHPEVMVVDLISGETTCKGMAEFAARYQQRFSASPNLHADLKSRIVLDSSVVDEEYVTGAAQFPGGLHAVAIYGFRDGLIDRVWFSR
jgi:hypothetical protein